MYRVSHAVSTCDDRLRVKHAYNHAARETGRLRYLAMGLWNKITAAFSTEGRERRRFLRDARAAAARIPGAVVVQERPEQFTLCLKAEGDDDEDVHRIYLGNTWQEMREAPYEQRVAHVERFLLDLFAARAAEPLSWEAVRERLLPVVRTGAAALLGDRRLPVVRRPFLPCLFESVVIDHDTNMQYVVDTDATAWGVAPAEIFEQARRNLESLEHAIAPFEDTPPGNVWRLASEDGYESSRLLLAGWLSSFRGRVEGTPVAFIPDRQTLLVCGSDNPGLLELLLRYVEDRVDESPRALSPVPYTLDDEDNVVPLDAGDDHPLGGAVRHAHLRLMGTQYAAQARHLEAIHDREGIDLFVAPCDSLMGKDGIEYTWSTWGRGIDTLLPQTDLVAIGVPDGAPSERWMTLVPWVDVSAIAAGWLERDPICDPPRYRAKAWPPEEIIAELRRRASTA
jgi:hypothetical protein